MRSFTGRGRALDGGTLIFDGLRVRLYGTALLPGATFASRAARAELARLTAGATLQVTPQGRDLRGCLLAHILLPDGRDLAQTLVSGGLLKADRPMSDLYARDQLEARRRGVGLWSAGTNH